MGILQFLHNFYSGLVATLQGFPGSPGVLNPFVSCQKVTGIVPTALVQGQHEATWGPIAWGHPWGCVFFLWVAPMKFSKKTCGNHMFGKKKSLKDPWEW